MPRKVASRSKGKLDEAKGKAKATVARLRGRPLDEAAGKRQKNRGKMKQAAGNIKKAGQKTTRDIRS